MDRETIKKLITLVEQYGLTELTVEDEGLSITIKAEEEAPASNLVPRQAACPPERVIQRVGQSVALEEPEVEIAEPDDESLYKITSPMIGVFYRCPSPDSPPYVEVGDMVEPGQTVGLIEAMKVFSEVPAEYGGRVVAIPAENGKLVQQGDVLVVIDTSIAE